ncbi:exodeoxyribonuclease IX, partial [candidate division WWE3 bacterium]|nr:exodeoxyribonuclease IX [candidate division WWE3 bacterium]
MARLLLIDTFNYIHRAYHALPKTFKDANGEPTNAIYGFTSMLISTLDLLRPSYAIAAFDDLEKPTFRDSDFTAYKANRK